MSPVEPVRVSVSRVVDAPAKTVYGILADYRAHHPNVLPKPEFRSLTVEKGGHGEGTLIRVEMKVFGSRSVVRMEVGEPEPGRVLRETDVVSGAVTTFTIDPVHGGARSRVEIATEWRRRPGLAGWIESKVNPSVARKLYARELALLEEYAKKLA